MQQGNTIKAMDLYPKLIDRCIPLSATPVSSRIFIDWRKQKLIDYSTSIKGNRKWVLLNLFEYIWVIICNDLRNYGVPNKFIIALKDVLISKTVSEFVDEGDIDKDSFIKAASNSANTIFSDEKIKKADIEQMIKNTEEIPTDDRFYLTGIGGLVVIVLFTNNNPIITLKLLGKESMAVDVSLISSSGDGVNDYINNALRQSFLSIPIRPIIEEFLAGEKKEEYVAHFQLLNDWEKNVIELLRSGDFKEVVITKSGKDEKKFIVKRTTKNELMGENVKELKKLFGLKNYKKVEITYRNDKHIYFENTVIEDL